jgi:hypothetical protein
MPYESPQNAQDETFVEPSSATTLHTKGVDHTAWTAINHKGAVKGGVLVEEIKGAVQISTDGSTVLCTVTTPVYLPLTFPFYIKAVASKSTATIKLVNHTLGGATVRRG